VLLVETSIRDATASKAGADDRAQMSTCF